jgi:DHA1 family bicyclomycin/chloramphenicol resistance-like MFS transporter
MWRQTLRRGAYTARPMNPDCRHHWRGPRWALALLLAGLGMLGPFAIDTYLPAFAGIATVAAGHAGADAADAVGLPVRLRGDEPVPRRAGRQLRPPAGGAVGHRGVHAGVGGLRAVPSIGMLVAFRALQGLSAGAGMVVSRVIVRDLFPPAEAQRVMSQVTIYFGVAPAVAPLVGGCSSTRLDWHADLLAAGGLRQRCCGW